MKFEHFRVLCHILASRSVNLPVSVAYLAEEGVYGMNSTNGFKILLGKVSADLYSIVVNYISRNEPNNLLSAYSSTNDIQSIDLSNRIENIAGSSLLFLGINQNSNVSYMRVLSDNTLELVIDDNVVTVSAGTLPVVQTEILNDDFKENINALPIINLSEEKRNLSVQLLDITRKGISQKIDDLVAKQPNVSHKKPSIPDAMVTNNEDLATVGLAHIPSDIEIAGIKIGKGDYRVLYKVTSSGKTYVLATSSKNAPRVLLLENEFESLTELLGDSLIMKDLL